MIRAALRLLATGVFNVVALVVGLILLGLAAGFVLWLFGKSYSSPRGYIVYSLLPLLLIFAGGLLWAEFGFRITDWWNRRRGRE